MQSSSQIQVNTSWMLPGELCWVELDNKLGNNAQSAQQRVYRKGQIKSLEAKNDYAIIQFIEKQNENEQIVLSSEECRISVNNLLECNKEIKSQGGWEDMVSMNVLNDAEILNNVNLRFSQDSIFSYIGPTLIVMNPYKIIQKSFNKDVLSLYQKAAKKGEGFQQSEYPPHVYALSANAYLQLFINNKNQAIVISGESGAGKTENAKFSMQYLTSLSDISHHNNNANNYQTNSNSNKQKNMKKNNDEIVPIEEKILGCNPILESFGNAKTVRNNNSSRFGKYVRIWIEKNQRNIVGACISNYLLEKSRVTIVAEGERNYHIFYSFLSGVNEGIINEYKLNRDPKSYNYLNQTSSLLAEGIDDIENFHEVQQSFHKLSFTASEEKSIYSLLAAILLLGNVEFNADTYSDANNTPCSVANMNIIEQIASILQINHSELMNSLVYKRRIFAGKPIDSPINKQECCITRDSLSRALYDRLFGWLVSRLNKNIMADDSVNMNNCLSLGLLDIFGFENFKINSFEQLCINFTNEKLQQLYIVYVFKSEAEEFQAEGLNDYMKSIEFKDNQLIIDLISKPKKSIYDLLDDQCTINTGSDEALLKQILQEHSTNAHLVNQKPHLIKDTFVIKHTAKDVEYSINGFRIKNKDEISDSINEVITLTGNNDVKTIWLNDEINQSQQQQQQKVQIKSKSNKFLGAKFRNQIKELMDELSSCDVHFIRCIKPNEQKQKNSFDEQFVMLQIRYLGILESVRVRKEGFPSRFVYDVFYSRYYELCHQIKSTNPKKFQSLPIQQKKELCTTLFQHLIQQSAIKQQNQKNQKNPQQQQLKMENNVLFGHTKIYMKLTISNLLDESLLELFKKKEQMALRIAKNAKVYLYKKNIFTKIKQLKEKFKKFILLQKKYKAYLEKKRQEKLKKIVSGVNKLNAIKEMRLYQTFEIFNKAFLKNKQSKLFTILLNLFRKQNIIHKQNVFNIFKLLFTAIKPNPNILAQNNINSQLIGNASDNNKLSMNSNASNLSQDNTAVSSNITNDSQSLQSQQKQLQQPQQPQQQNNKQQLNELKNDCFHNILDSDNDTEESKNEKIVTDEFESEGLDIWPNMTEKEDENERKYIRDHASDNLIIFLRENIAAEFQSLNPKQSNIELEKAINLPTDPDYNVTFDDFDINLLKRVEDKDFFAFCNNYIIKSKKNFGKNIPSITQIMSYSNSNLVDPLTQTTTIQNHSQLIFRSLLKLAKNRRSRFPPQTHIENIILMCYGTPEKMQESIFSSVREENTKIVQDYSSRVQTQSIQQQQQRQQQLQQQQMQQQQQQDSNHSSMDSTINQSALQQDNDDEPNIKEILATKMMQIINNCHQPIRDETYMQLCKQIHNQPTLESTKILLLFFSEILGLFPPSEFLTLPLMNYFKYICAKSTDDKVQRECRYIFTKLAKIWQSYNMIKMIDFSQYTEQFLSEYNLFKDVNRDIWMKEVLQKEINQFDFFYNHVQRVDIREVLPTDWERSIAHEHKFSKVKIYLLNEMSVNVTVESFYSVKQVRDIVLRKLGLAHRSQYYGIIISKLTEGKYFEVFLKNNQKILDVINQTINDTKYLEGYKKTVVTKFYLRIKICYRLYKSDFDSVVMYFMQAAFDVRFNRHNLKPQEAFTLAAYHLFVEFGPFEPSQETLYRKKCTDFLPNQMITPKTFNELYQKILPIYRSLNLESQNQARWKYLEILRTKDTFMTYQLEAHQFSLKPNGEKFTKNKEGQLVLLGIRPYQIVILNIQDKSTREVIELEQIETWGLNQSQRSKTNQTQQFFFLKIKECDLLYVFHILYLQVANLLIHSYALKKSMGDEDNEYKEWFLDILSILFDKEEVIE